MVDHHGYLKWYCLLAIGASNRVKFCRTLFLAVNPLLTKIFLLLSLVSLLGNHQQSTCIFSTSNDFGTFPVPFIYKESALSLCQVIITAVEMQNDECYQTEDSEEAQILFPRLTFPCHLRCLNSNEIST